MRVKYESLSPSSQGFCFVDKNLRKQNKSGQRIAKELGMKIIQVLGKEELSNQGT